MPICKWCNLEFSKLAKSHVIPQAFVNFDGITDKYLISTDRYRARRPIGSYDSSILCLKCEHNYSHIDSEAADILLHKFDKELIKFNDERDQKAFQIDGKFSEVIKKFLIYVLWRASVSQLHEFQAVKLGPYEEIIKSVLVNKENIGKYDYSFMAYRVENPIGTLFPFPRVLRDYDGQKYYCLIIANYLFDIKIDNRKPTNVYKVVADHPHVVFVKLATIEGNLKKVMKELLLRHEAKFGKIPRT
jgi:hypothetical protein